MEIKRRLALRKIKLNLLLLNSIKSIRRQKLKNIKITKIKAV